MNLFKFGIKLTAQILFVIIFFSTLRAENLSKFNKGNYISDYFSGLLLLNNSNYQKSYKFLDKLNGLEKSHINYSSKYILSLINSGKFNEAFSYAKKLEKMKLANFETDLIIGIYYLKNKKYDLAERYFSKLQKRESKFVINNFISNSLSNWISFNNVGLEVAKDKISSIDSKFENLKIIQNVFAHCFYNSDKTPFLFQNLSKNKKTDFSRYNYFYAVYLSDQKKVQQALEVINSSLELYPRNLLLNQYKTDLKGNQYENNFDCRNLSHIISEILYIAANALSSQEIYNLSNFYLNLSKYLNNNFYSFDTLLAENFYKIKNYKKAKKIYNNLGKKGEAFLWYSAKQNAKILNIEKQNQLAFQTLDDAYKKLSSKSFYVKFDYAQYLKNNDKFKKSITLYTDIIEKIDRQHTLYAKSTHGRGVAYERIGEWNKAEKDLLSSLKTDPEQAYVINYLAYSWIEQGIKVDQSLEMLQKANELKSNDPYIIDSLGWALFKLKRYSDAKEYLKLAVKLLPADPVINDHYGDVLWKSGDQIQARYYWSYVLGLEESEKTLKDSIEDKLILGL